MTGLDIHRDNYNNDSNNADWAFDYVSNNNIQHQQNKTKTKEYIHLVAGCLKPLPPSILLLFVNIIIITIIIIIIIIIIITSDTVKNRF